LKSWLPIIACFILCRCTEEKGLRECLVIGTLSTDSIPSIHIHYLDDLSPVLDAKVELSNDLETHVMIRSGSKWHANGVVWQPNELIHLKCQLADYAIEATTKMPPDLDFTLVSNNLISINPNSTGSPALVVQWTALTQQDYSYLLKLEPLSTEPSLIPFTVPAGRFLKPGLFFLTPILNITALIG
jgi:hypothetical protein